MPLFFLNLHNSINLRLLVSILLEFFHLFHITFGFLILHMHTFLLYLHIQLGFFIEGHHNCLVRCKVLIPEFRYCINISLCDPSLRSKFHIQIAWLGEPDSFHQSLVLLFLLILLQILPAIIFCYFIWSFFPDPTWRLISQFLEQSLILDINCHDSIEFSERLLFYMRIRFSDILFGDS